MSLSSLWRGIMLCDVHYSLYTACLKGHLQGSWNNTRCLARYCIVEYYGDGYVSTVKLKCQKEWPWALDPCGMVTSHSSSTLDLSSWLYQIYVGVGSVAVGLPLPLGLGARDCSSTIFFKLAVETQPVQVPWSSVPVTLSQTYHVLAALWQQCE